MDKIEILLRALANRFHSDNGLPEFNVLIDDPDRGTWAVSEKHYVDADRAGYCGYDDEPVIEGLDQVDAVWLAKSLNEMRERLYREDMSKYGYTSEQLDEIVEKLLQRWGLS